MPEPEVLVADPGAGKTERLLAAAREWRCDAPVVIVCGHGERAARLLLDRLLGHPEPPLRVGRSTWRATYADGTRISFTTERQVREGRLRGLDRGTVVLLDDADLTEYGIYDPELQRFDFRLATCRPDLAHQVDIDSFHWRRAQVAALVTQASASRYREAGESALMRLVMLGKATPGEAKAIDAEAFGRVLARHPLVGHPRPTQVTGPQSVRFPLGR